MHPESSARFSGRGGSGVTESSSSEAVSNLLIGTPPVKEGTVGEPSSSIHSLCGEANACWDWTIRSEGLEGFNFLSNKGDDDCIFQCVEPTVGAALAMDMGARMEEYRVAD